MEVVHSENIALFEKGRINGTILKYTYQDIELLHPYTGAERDLYFEIGVDDRLIDLSMTRLRLGIKVVKDDNTEFHLEYKTLDDGVSEIDRDNPKNEYAIPIDCIFHSMWKSVQVFYENNKISGSSRNYAYKAFLDILLSTTFTAKTTILHLIGLATDHDNFDATNPRSAIANRGLQRRYEMTRNGKELFMQGGLLNDLWKQKHLLVNDRNIKVVFEANKEIFRLMMQPPTLDAHIELIKPVLRVARVTPTDEVKKALEEMKKEEPVEYPHRLGKIKTRSVNAGERTYAFTNVFNGMIPTKLVIGFVEEEAYSGHKSKNPFKFSNLDIINAEVMVGSEALPGKGYKLDFSKGQFADALENLYSIFSPTCQPMDIGVTREQFKEGLCLLAFDLDPSTPGDLSTWGLPRSGNLDLNVEFRENIKKTHELIMYGIFPATVELDSKGSVVTNELLLQ